MNVRFFVMELKVHSNSNFTMDKLALGLQIPNDVYQLCPGSVQKVEIAPICGLYSMKEHCLPDKSQSLLMDLEIHVRNQTYSKFREVLLFWIKDLPDPFPSAPSMIMNDFDFLWLSLFSPILFKLLYDK